MAENNEIKANFFRSPQKHLAKIDLTLAVGQHPFSVEHCPKFFISFVSLIAHFVYLFRVAENDKEYIVSFYMSMMGSLVFVCSLSTIYKVTRIYDFFDLYEKTANESE